MFVLHGRHAVLTPRALIGFRQNLTSESAATILRQIAEAMNVSMGDSFAFQVEMQDQRNQLAALTASVVEKDPGLEALRDELRNERTNFEIRRSTWYDEQKRLIGLIDTLRVEMQNEASRFMDIEKGHASFNAKCWCLILKRMDGITTDLLP